ncbi:PREDICTED: ubiquitin carboxyl-terminal hydrolase 27-like isoform X2 [Camelina sativa]|uniref:ubiquitinyl hydrolase 1 n=1 Tax=Camelina sativa TaxID=90675 RepID=A0ABM0UUB5_CAMSA|nr:PREDICTED: ubiquitin carboxyl-terminal hydrolase 27-like isoform X2 [Camelina sativa]
MVSLRGSSDTRAIVCILTDKFKVSNNWVSHLSLATTTILGVAGFIFALKDGRFRNLKLFSASEKDDAFLVPGLQNLGNNCFLNVILQALASCKDFRSFLEWVIEDARDTVTGEMDQHFPLTFALSALLQELCTVGRRRSVSNPREVMLALTDYARNFNLTSQQDAAEALLHLISSLQQEIVFCYRPLQSSNLSDILFSRNLRMLAPSEGLHGLMELKRWHKHLRGPFDGILGSTLMCRTCSSQISLEFQFFHTLPLSPLLHSGGSNIMFGCTLENCLKKFLDTEKVENFFCHRCWHGAALKYLSVIGAPETDIEKLRNCGGDDQCDCKTSHFLERMPWSNSYSHILKQLIISRFPKLLCIQVQRASFNMYGESYKLTGHIAFPLVLDLSLFAPSPIGLNKVEGIQMSSKYQKAEASRNSDNLYRLVTVVEHFGITGSGHYTVYRSVRVASQEEEEEEEEECEELRWFSISDSEVSRVSESDVLGAEASLLFYERV